MGGSKPESLLIESPALALLLIGGLAMLRRRP